MPLSVCLWWGQMKWNSVRWGQKIYTSQLEQPRQNKNLLFWHNEPNGTKEGPFHLYSLSHLLSLNSQQGPPISFFRCVYFGCKVTNSWTFCYCLVPNKEFMRICKVFFVLNLIVNFTKRRHSICNPEIRNGMPYESWHVPPNNFTAYLRIILCMFLNRFHLPDGGNCPGALHHCLPSILQG